MAADVGLIKSVSQAFKSEEANSKLGENLRYGFGKIAEGISKRGDIQREQKAKDDLRREKQDAAQKRSADTMQNNLLETSSHAKTPKQTDMILSKAKEWRSESNGYFKIMAESSSDSPEYMKAQEGLLKIRTGMQNSVSSLDSLNSIMESRASLAENSGYADFNTVKNEGGDADDSILDRTNSFLEEDYEAKWDDDGFLVISDGKDEEGNSTYSSIGDYDKTLARVADTTVSDNFVGITSALEKEGDKGYPIDEVGLQHDFNLYREDLIKPGQGRTDQLLTMFTDNPIPGVDLRDGKEDLIKALQSSDINIRTQAKREAVDYLFGEKNSKEGFLYQTASKLHKGKLDRYNAIKDQEQKDRMAVAKASGGKGTLSISEQANGKVINALSILSKQFNEPGSDLSKLVKGNFDGSTNVATKNEKLYKETAEELKNVLRKHLGDNQLKVNLKMDDNGRTRFMLSGSDDRSSGSYTVEELFAPATDINGLSYKFATLDQALGKE
tara:strand:- start:6145 stop:7641 length:1497 start_codon:yes stop_codon:yes gene_type:complete